MYTLYPQGAGQKKVGVHVPRVGYIYHCLPRGGAAHVKRAISKIFKVQYVIMTILM